MSDLWQLFYDEAFHDRKIVPTNNNVNIYNDTSGDIFVGTLWGCKKENLDVCITKFRCFEDKFKQVYSVHEDKELKGTTIGKKNFKYGISTFNNNCFTFYYEFFDLIKDDMILHINMVSKTEFLIRKVFENLIFPPYILFNSNAFIYSLIKFLFNYRDIGYMQKLCSKDLKLTPKEILDYLKELLFIVIKNTRDVKRKQIEIKTISELLFILEKSNLLNNAYNEITWEYNHVFEGLNLLLSEMNIQQKQVSLIIDKEEHTYNAAIKAGNYYSVKEVESYQVAGIRISDILSNFIGRMLVALDRDLNEGAIENLNELQGFDFATKRILSPYWFELTESKYNLYKKVCKIFNIRESIKWTTYSGIYFDYPTLLLCLFNYIGQEYNTYNDFKRIDAELHSEYFNTYSTNALKVLYNEFL